jgi:hypothetical protein
VNLRDQIMLAAVNACPEAPPGVQPHQDMILSWVKWGVLAIMAISWFVSIGLLVWGRVTSHPKGARLGMDGLMINMVAAVVFVVGWAVVASIVGKGC